MLNSLFRFATPILAAALAMVAPALAEDYPGRTVTLVVPYPAGGGVDTVGRIIAQKLTAARVPITEPAPGRFSTMTCWPSAAVSFCAMTRPTVSTPPPTG